MQDSMGRMRCAGIERGRAVGGGSQQDGAGGGASLGAERVGRPRDALQWRRLSTFATAAVALLAGSSRGQTSNLKTYYVNDGRSDAYESGAAETQVDLGGFIPFSRYSENLTSGGHKYAVPYDAGGFSPLFFRQLMKERGLDLYKLDAALDATVAGGAGQPPTLLPFGVRAAIDPELLAYNALPIPDLKFPIELTAWWNCTSGGVGGTTGQRKVLVWPYRINGGAMMICIASDGNRGIARRTPEESSSILLVNYPFHWRHLGTNKNRWRDAAPGVEWPRQFSGPTGVPFMAYDGGRFSTGTEVLGMQAQAIEDGDIVVYVGENMSNNLWISIQRTQEAEAFVRKEWATAPPGDPAAYPAVPVGNSFLDGLSWGQLSSGTMCFLQPAIYSGTAAWNINDFGYAQADYYDLQYDVSVGLGHAGWLPGTDPIWSTQWALIDALGIRFDRPWPGQTGWDLAALSMNRRPGSLQLPVNGRLGDNEFNYPMHWPSKDSSLSPFGTNGAFAPKFLKNWEHDPTAGFIPGVNEFAAWDGTEWNTLESGGVIPSPTQLNPELVPSAAAPATPYPDPFTHTLRHVHVDPSPNHAVLAQVDAGASLTPPYRIQTPGPGANLNTIGQGTWIGYHDTMHVLDLDGDGNMEVVFANFEGYVHILEFHPGGFPGDSSGAIDPYRLYDEWKSPYLGRGIIGSDCVFGAGKAQMFFGTGNGEVFRIDATAANTYVVQNTGLPIVSALTGGGNPAYAGTTPMVVVADMAGTSNRELIVVNRFLDWSLYQLNGSPVGNGKLFRPTHAIGPTDAFPVVRPVTSSVNTDSNRELLVSASDGHVWWFDFDASPLGSNQWLEPSPAIPYTGLSLFKVVPIYSSSPTTPSQLLVFGRNDDKDDDANFDGAPDGQPDTIQLWDLATQALVFELPASLSVNFDGFDAAMSFTWVNKPSTQTIGIGRFAIATGATIQIYDLYPLSISLNITKQIFFPPFADAAKSTNCITSLDAAALKPSASGTAETRLVFADCSGRVYVLDQSLNYLRDSSIDFVGATLPPNTQWAERASNQTLAGNFAYCAEDHAPTPDGGGKVYVADYAAAALRKIVGGKPTYPVYAIDFGSLGGNSWEKFLSPTGVPTTSILQATNEDSFDLLRPNFNRTLIYRDLDGVNGRDLEILAETGTAYFDNGSGTVRRFQTSSYNPYRPSGVGPAAYLGDFWGGRVFEHPTKGSLYAYDFLGNFVIPKDSLHFSFGSSTANGWWYPSKGGAFLEGQIESHWQSASSQGLGTSMKSAILRSGSIAGTMTKQIVVGTNGGFVYAIEPGAQPAVSHMVASKLTYATPDLGSFIVGLDCGDLNGDGVDEIVCGCSLDDGSYVDWKNGVTSKNRGKLYVIDTTLPAVVGAGQGIEPLTGDSSFPSPNAGAGIGASVFGVKIDDVDNDGTKEIWCTDQFHVYLFYKTASGGGTSTGTWKVATRTADLGCFPGSYNNLFPLKNAAGKTVRLVVVSPGYVMEFTVDPDAVP